MLWEDFEWYYTAIDSVVALSFCWIQCTLVAWHLFRPQVIFARFFFSARGRRLSFHFLKNREYVVREKTIKLALPDILETAFLISKIMFCSISQISCFPPMYLRIATITGFASTNPIFYVSTRAARWS